MSGYNEVIIYRGADGLSDISVRFEGETAWLTLDQMAELFGRDKSTISRHIRNIFSERELQAKAVVAIFATTASDGKVYQVDHYNLDMIISVGYRVKSIVATRFRQWARLHSWLYGAPILQGKGGISEEEAESKAREEFQKYRNKTLSAVEREHLKRIATPRERPKQE